MSPKSILVIGAGELGTAVLRSLVEHPSRSQTEVAVLLRPSTIESSDPTKSNEIQHLKDLGVKVVSGDVVEDSIEHLAETLSSFHTIINCSGMSLPPGTQTRVAKAALASRCGRYFPWQFGVDYDTIGRNSSQDLFTEQLDVRDLLRGQQSTDFTIISTGLFLSFLFEPAFGIVNESRDTVTAVGSWTNAVTVTSPDDIGKVTAEIALLHPDLKDVVFVAGDTISMQQLADTIDTVVQKPVQHHLKTVAQLKAELAEDPDNGLRKYRVVFAEGVGVSWDKMESFNERNGIATQTVLDWAKVNLLP